MKTLSRLVSLSLILAAASAHGQVIAYEPFNYALGSNLATAPIGTLGWAGRWTYDGNGTVAIVPGLTWKDSLGRPLRTSTSLAPGASSRAVQITSSAADWSIDRTITNGTTDFPGMLFSDNTDYWISFLVRMSVPMTNFTDASVTLPGEAGDPGHWTVFGQYRFGGPDLDPTCRPYAENYNYNYPGINLPGGSVQFFVVHVTGRPSNQQDVVDVYLNPLLNATPGLSPTFSVSSGSCTSCPSALSRTIRLRMRPGSNGFPSPPYTATFDEIRVGRTFADVAPLAPCGKADVGTQGALPGFDGLLDNNDFIVFIDSFFAGSDAADIGQQGGEAGTDGLLDNNDFVVYINQFFQAC